YPSDTTPMPVTTTCHGKSPPKPMGTAMAVDATDRTTRCPSSLHVVTADTAPAWSRLKWIAEAIDTTASSLSRTANNAASESIQFSSHQARQTSASKGRNSKNASKGRGCDWGETKPTTIPEPANPTRAASAAATRKKFNLN